MVDNFLFFFPEFFCLMPHEEIVSEIKIENIGERWLSSDLNIFATRYLSLSHEIRNKKEME